MPTIAENIQVEYQALDPIHMPGSFFVYKGTKSSTYDIGDLKLISRTPMEATANQAIRNTLRGWTKPYFGFGTANGKNVLMAKTKEEWQRTVEGDKSKTEPLNANDIAGVLQSNGWVTPGATNGASVLTEDQKRKLLTSSNKTKAQFLLSVMNDQSGGLPQSARPMFNGGNDSFKRVAVADGTQTVQRGKQFLGAPPEVLYLTAYSDPVLKGGQLDRSTNIFKIPVVITNLSINYPNDVDYIPTIDGEPFPIIMSISLALVETHSPREFENFDIFKYRDGKLPGF